MEMQGLSMNPRSKHPCLNFFMVSIRYLCFRSFPVRFNNVQLFSILHTTSHQETMIVSIKPTTIPITTIRNTYNVCDTSLVYSSEIQQQFKQYTFLTSALKLVTRSLNLRLKILNVMSRQIIHPFFRNNIPSYAPHVCECS